MIPDNELRDMYRRFILTMEELIESIQKFDETQPQEDISDKPKLRSAELGQMKDDFFCFNCNEHITNILVSSMIAKCFECGQSYVFLNNKWVINKRKI